jgi:hypothetical protein
MVDDQERKVECIAVSMMVHGSWFMMVFAARALESNGTKEERR